MPPFRRLPRSGRRRFLVAHDRARGEATVEEIRRTTRSDRVEVLVAALSSQDSIRELAEVFRRDHDRLDVLVNCASAFFRRRRVTKLFVCDVCRHVDDCPGLLT